MCSSDLKLDMVQFNFFRREVNCKIVYYGPGLSGKTTNLEMVHKKTPAGNRGDLTSIATEQDRTLFFDFMPIDLGTVGGMKTKLRLFTVPGQVFYNSTRKLVLQGADGVIFVADSQKHKMDENLESLRNLEENLREHNMDIREMPLVIQWNKRDMPTALPVEELEKLVNYLHVPTFEGVAVTGEGVFPTLKKCAALVLESVTKQANQATQTAAGPGAAGPSALKTPPAAKGPMGPAIKTPMGHTMKGPLPPAAKGPAGPGHVIGQHPAGPISPGAPIQRPGVPQLSKPPMIGGKTTTLGPAKEIGRASCRERV